MINETNRLKDYVICLLLALTVSFTLIFLIEDELIEFSKRDSGYLELTPDQEAVIIREF